MLEGRFEQRGRGARVDDLAGLLKRRRDVPVVVCDPMATGKAPARGLADLVSGIEDRLEDIVGGGGELGREGVVPQAKRALGPGEVARLGESGTGFHDEWSTVWGGV